MTGGQLKGVQDVAVLLQGAQEEQEEGLAGRRGLGGDPRPAAAEWKRRREEVRHRTEGLPHALRLRHRRRNRSGGRDGVEAVVDELGVPRAAAAGRGGAQGEGAGAAHEGGEADAQAAEPHRAEDLILVNLDPRRRQPRGGRGEPPLHRPEPG